MTRSRIVLAFACLFAPLSVFADERFFTYSYQADVLPQGGLELEQFVTDQHARSDGDYRRFDFRTELEYGLTDRLMTALYYNWRHVNQEGASDSDGVYETDFSSVSSEWIYQILNPNLDPVGLALYGEYSTDGQSHELETKILLSKRIDQWELVGNIAYEGESEKSGDAFEREATLTFTAGAAYKLNQHWALGLELRNKSAYPDGFNLRGQEYQSWSVGPNIHYGSSGWWMTFTVLPQVWGNGDGAESGKQLVHEESTETRLIVGFHF